jgi:predicted metalloprotease with PDZ domain
MENVMLRKTFAPSLLCLAFCLILTGAAAVPGQDNNGFRVDYTVEVRNPEIDMFHVTANVKNIKQPRLELSLPTWTPGWYTIENYGKNILRFKITDARGTPLPHMMTRKQTWNVETKGLDQLKIEFDYRANVLALNQAKVSRDFAFFTGTELFLMAVGHRESPSLVRFVLPQGWKIISALKETSDPAVFTAPDYDTLVDAPTEMGNFDVTRFLVEGKPHYFVATPAGAFSAEKSQKFAKMLGQVASAQSAIFGGLPYEKYVYFYFFSPPESNASGALEHLNSHVSFAPPATTAQPEGMIGTASHEFFHLWNVKRIRPAEMWPYDYSRENETPLLWVSEGFTNYYGNVGTYRAGLLKQEDFLARAAEAIGGVENNEARAFISPAESSASTWVGYDTPVAFGISYYTQGQNLGALLDLSIRHDTAGRASLDDVMRTLYKEFYQRGKGFSMEDMIGVVNRLTKQDYHDFYRRYVWGVEVPPYETVYGYAGYRVEKTTQKGPVFGFGGRFKGGGFNISNVESNSPAAESGLAVGDIIMKINGEEFQRIKFNELAGKTIKLTVKHEGEAKEIPMKVGAHEETGYHLVAMPQATADQLKIREGWLKVGQ